MQNTHTANVIRILLVESKGRGLVSRAAAGGSSDVWCPAGGLIPCSIPATTRGMRPHQLYSHHLHFYTTREILKWVLGILISAPSRPASQPASTPCMSMRLRWNVVGSLQLLAGPGGHQPPPHQPRSNISDRFSFSQNVSYEVGRLRLAGVKLIYTEHNSPHFSLGKPVLLLSFQSEILFYYYYYHFFIVKSKSYG